MLGSHAMMNGANGSLSLKTTVCGSVAITSAARCMIGRERGCISTRYFFAVKTTSSAVKGVPSCHFTFSWSLNV